MEYSPRSKRYTLSETETFVYNGIQISFTNERIMQPLYYYRDFDQNEIDLVLIKGSTLSCIEIKADRILTFLIQKGFRNCRIQNINPEKMALSALPTKYHPQ